jgi:hypothetical protein
MENMWSRLSSLLVAACLCGCGHAELTPPQLHERDIAVFTAALACQNSGATMTMVVSDLPPGGDHWGVPTDWDPKGLYNAELTRRGNESSRWPVGKFCREIHVETDESIEATFQGDIRIPPGWEHFGETFGGARGLLRISRPAFSLDGKHAVISEGYYCEGLCGSGMLLELEFSAGAWRVTRITGTWQS